MFQKLVGTSNDWTLTVLRLVMGAVFFAHGAQKMLGWFGGYGFSGTMGFFTNMMHIPALFRIAGHLRGVFWRHWFDRGSIDSDRGVWNRDEHDGGYPDGAREGWLLHELDGAAEGRGL